jgi:NAD(P)-dependent dehydrogenase (short-subunit alcohol dehydrogenase family)
LPQLTEVDFAYSIANTLLSQVHLVRLGFACVRNNGSFTLTGGTLAHSPMVGGAAISVVMAGLEGFTRAAALEAPRGIRVNLVSPPWITETLTELAMDPSQGLSAATVAQAYQRSLATKATGTILRPGGQDSAEPA